MLSSPLTVHFFGKLCLIISICWDKGEYTNFLGLFFLFLRHKNSKKPGVALKFWRILTVWLLAEVDKLIDVMLKYNQAENGSI